MFEFILKLIGFKEIPPPEKGEIWYFKSKDPFEKSTKIYVMQVKEGWVSYGYHPTRPMMLLSCKINRFIAQFKRPNQQKPKNQKE